MVNGRTWPIFPIQHGKFDAVNRTFDLFGPETKY